MIFLFGFQKKPVGKENRTVMKDGVAEYTVITVYRAYFEIFFIPVLPLGKYYSIYLPASGKYYENGIWQKMPEKYLEICREVGRKY